MYVQLEYVNCENGLATTMEEKADKEPTNETMHGTITFVARVRFSCKDRT